MRFGSMLREPSRMEGVSVIELVIIVAVVTISSGILLVRVMPLHGRAEQIAFEQTRQGLQSALQLEAAERLLRAESTSLTALADRNPVEWLPTPPANYHGTLTSLGDRQIPPQSWYFDDQDRSLVYLPGVRSSLFRSGRRPKELRLKVRFSYTDRDRDGSFDAAIDDFGSLRLESPERR